MDKENASRKKLIDGLELVARKLERCQWEGRVRKALCDNLTDIQLQRQYTIGNRLLPGDNRESFAECSQDKKDTPCVLHYTTGEQDRKEYYGGGMVAE